MSEARDPGSPPARRARWLARLPPLLALAMAIALAAVALRARGTLDRATGPGAESASWAREVRWELDFTLAGAAAILLLSVVWLRLERKRESLAAKAQQDRHLASLGEMTAVLAHEIRNPLAALKGHAQLLVEMTPEGRARQKAERVVHEALRLERLTNDLLTFVRSGRLRRDPTDVRVLVEQVVSAAGSTEVRAVLQASEATAPLDRVRVLQALENLVRNALQHGKSPVEVTVTSEPKHVAISVRDHGPGIPEGREERIFEPFVTDATRGTGLGLAVVKRVVDLHGGTVTARNHADGGAVFLVRLPR